MSTPTPATTPAPGAVRTLSRPTPARGGPLAGSLRRTAALARAELVVLGRNKTMLSTIVGLPLAFVALLATVAGDALASATGAAGAVSLLTASMLLFVVYYPVLSAAVARREEGVLQRFRTGESSDGEVLVALSLPTVVITAVMVGVLVVAGVLVLDMPLPSNPLPVVLAVLLGAAALAVIALLTTVVTRTLESAQITCLPVVAVCTLGGGVVVPLDGLPPVLRTVAELTPLSPVVELLRAGWLAGASAGEVAAQVGILLGWTVLGGLAVRRTFRWSPRS